MSRARWSRTRSNIFLGLATFALCWACSSSSSDGGSTGSAGSTQAGSGGKPNGTAGTNAAGTSANGGSANGGTSGSAGSGTAGKPSAGDCGITACLVANTCLDKCGGTVVYTGCCPCIAPAVNKNSCDGNQ